MRVGGTKATSVSSAPSAPPLPEAAFDARSATPIPPTVTTSGPSSAVAPTSAWTRVVPPSPVKARWSPSTEIGPRLRESGSDTSSPTEPPSEMPLFDDQTSAGEKPTRIGLEPTRNFRKESPSPRSITTTPSRSAKESSSSASVAGPRTVASTSKPPSSIRPPSSFHGPALGEPSSDQVTSEPAGASSSVAPAGARRSPTAPVASSPAETVNTQSSAMRWESDAAPHAMFVRKSWLTSSPGLAGMGSSATPVSTKASPTCPLTSGRTSSSTPSAASGAVPKKRSTKRSRMGSVRTSTPSPAVRSASSSTSFAASKAGPVPHPYSARSAATGSDTTAASWSASSASRVRSPPRSSS